MGLLMGVADVYRLPIDDRQGVTQFIAYIALIIDGSHGMNEVSVVLIGVTPNCSIENIKTTNCSVGPAFEFTAEMSENLLRTYVSRCLMNSGRAPVGH